MVLSTIGYEQATIDDFVGTLIAAGIQTVIDVRERPLSRRKGFSKKALADALKNVGIDYVHLVGLGDPKAGRDAAKAGDFGEFQKIFVAHMETAEFKADLERASALVAGGDACLMCYERSPGKCHRKFVADSLSGILGVDVRHLGVREGAAKDGRKIGTREGAHPC